MTEAPYALWLDISFESSLWYEPFELLEDFLKGEYVNRVYNKIMSIHCKARNVTLKGPSRYYLMVNLD